MVPFRISQGQRLQRPWGPLWPFVSVLGFNATGESGTWTRGDLTWGRDIERFFFGLEFWGRSRSWPQIYLSSSWMYCPSFQEECLKLREWDLGSWTRTRPRVITWLGMIILASVVMNGWLLVAISAAITITRVASWMGTITIASITGTFTSWRGSVLSAIGG